MTRITEIFISVVNEILHLRVHFPKLVPKTLSRLLYLTLKKHACVLLTYTKFERRAFPRKNDLGLVIQQFLKISINYIVK